MRIHILGICGTFMGGLAVLAAELGCEVTGSDQNIYPPMSLQLEQLGIKIFHGYDDLTPLSLKPDYILVGNVMTRGMPIVEALLNQNLPFLSGPEWLARFVLQNKHVLAVSGTHGKTTTSSMLAWILEKAGLTPGFLIGGVPNNFGISARLGAGAYFVVEADEYDCSFFDKRSKFVHYRPRTLIINNLEFDHADIFRDITEIQRQFHHLVRTVPSEGLIIYPEFDHAIVEVLDHGCWSQTVAFCNQCGKKSLWHVKNATVSGNQFDVYHQDQLCDRMAWSLIGEHNVHNALAAIIAAEHAGVDPKTAIASLCQFKSVKRRLELKGIQRGITVYDDFAHHPTAIGMTLAGLRAKISPEARIIAILDIRSNTMKAGHYQTLLAASVKAADHVYFFKSPDILWDVEKIWIEANKPHPGGVYSTIQSLLQDLLNHVKSDDQVIFMSNGGFGGIQMHFLEKLKFFI